MKATLTFKLPEDQEEFNDAVNGNAFKAVIWEIDQWMRSQIKHQDMPDEVAAKVVEIRDELRQIMNHHNVTYE